MDISTYCYEKHYLHRDVDSRYIYNYSAIYLVPKSQDNSSSYIIRLIDDVVGFDVVETFTDFFQNTNTDRTQGFVGFYYYVLSVLPFGSCTRANLSCVNGSGLEVGFFVAVGLTIGYGILLALILPPLSQISSFLVNLLYGSPIIFFIYTFLRVSYDWQSSCILNVEAQPINYLFPFLGNIPLFPECTPSEIVNAIDTYVLNPCAFNTLTGGVFDALMLPFPDGTVYNCSNTNTCFEGPVQFLSCYDYGFTSSLQSIGILLLRYFPSVASDLRSSCLVRGGCFNFIDGMSFDASNYATTNGILGSLFSGYNATQLTLGSNPILNSCMYFVLFLDVFSIVFVLASLVLILFAGFWAFVFAVEGIRWIIALMSAPPVYYLFVPDPEDEYYGDDGQGTNLILSN